MSYDISIKAVPLEPIEVYESNYTYNVSGMLRDAYGGDWKEIYGMRCDAAAEILYKMLQKLLADPEKYKAMNPANGWGDYDGCVKWVREMIEACDEYPHGTFYVN